MNENNNLTINAGKSLFWMPLIIGVALVISVSIGAYAFYVVRSFDNSLSVTGSAKMEVTSDVVKWRANFSRIVTLPTLKSGYQLMANDEKAVRAFLKAKGVNDSEITISPVSMEEIYDYQNQNIQTEKRYTLRQQVTVDSNDVNKITEVAKDPVILVSAGVIFASNSLEYYYSKLAEARVNLLSDAIKDAKARAEKIAEASGKSIGQLKSASSGVVQVLPLNSVDVSDYGTYATGDMKKEVMVTVKAAFSLKGTINLLKAKTEASVVNSENSQNEEMIRNYDEDSSNSERKESN